MTNWAKREYAITDSNEIPLVAGKEINVLLEKFPSIFKEVTNSSRPGEKENLLTLPTFIWSTFMMELEICVGKISSFTSMNKQ